MGARIDEVFALDGETGAAEGAMREREHALMSVLAEANGPTALTRGRIERKYAAPAAVQTRAGDGPIGEDGGESVQGVAFTDGAEIEVQLRGMRRERVSGGIEREERCIGGLRGGAFRSVRAIEGAD